MTAVGKGNIDVGNQYPIAKPGVIVDRPARSDVLPGPRFDTPGGPTDRRNQQLPFNNGAMSLQGGDGGRGNQSAPQKFVRLVGYRDPNSGPWIRPRPDTAKQ